MLDNFFKLNGEPKEVKKPSDFKSIVSGERGEIRDILYRPDFLKNDEPHPRYKIQRKTFINVSFTKTRLKNIDFTLCHFEDCLFIGSQIVKCQFHQCTFKNVNTHQISIKQTYIDPVSFKKNYERKDIEKSNLAVHLFQQLLDNSRDEEQSEFARVANYYFKKWQGRLTRSKYFKNQPYKINEWEFAVEYFPNFLYRWIFGYGLRLRSFIATFLVIYGIFYFINIKYWCEYGFHVKDFAIASFQSEKISPVANIFFTADAMTQLVDSQFQPKTDFGMSMLTLQGFSGFILLSFLITVLINRFVK
ncbi:pentapeptide repeat-containing protein [Maribacter aestuarii]|uniref:pentapeptide repeat-containing protein n=1 Tax=Maribacter aestuarii TaxID=1130723 RepID=UPI00248BFAC9|nr:pentapeptide repeat-containing protein [Maribacter aestuarii]